MKKILILIFSLVSCSIHFAWTYVLWNNQFIYHLCLLNHYILIQSFSYTNWSFNLPVESLNKFIFFSSNGSLFSLQYLCYCTILLYISVAIRLYSISQSQFVPTSRLLFVCTVYLSDYSALHLGCYLSLQYISVTIRL